MDTEYGRIHVERHQDRLTHWFSYTWEGAPVTILDYRFISRFLDIPYPPKVGQKLTIAQYKVVIIDVDPYMPRITVMRIDDRLWVLRYVQHTIKNHLASVNMKLLLTLDIWGFLDLEIGKIPEWKDLKVYKWIAHLF